MDLIKKEKSGPLRLSYSEDVSATLWAGALYCRSSIL